MARTTRTAVHQGWRPARSPTGPPIPWLRAAATGSSPVGWTTGRGSSSEAGTTRALGRPAREGGATPPAAAAAGGGAAGGGAGAGVWGAGGAGGGVVVGGVVVADELGGGGALEVGLLVGALEVGADDCGWCEVGGGGGGGGGGAAVCPDSGGVPVTLAGSGKFSTGTPRRSAFIT